MKRLECTCDGCGRVEFYALPEFVEISELREIPTIGWVYHRIIAIENNSAPVEVKAELCPRCTENLRRALNPVAWPKLRSTAVESRVEEFPSSPPREQYRTASRKNM
jgi:hypothetical protein